MALPGDVGVEGSGGGADLEVRVGAEGPHHPGGEIVGGDEGLAGSQAGLFEQVDDVGTRTGQHGRGGGSRTLHRKRLREAEAPEQGRQGFHRRASGRVLHPDAVADVGEVLRFLGEEAAAHVEGVDPSGGRAAVEAGGDGYHDVQHERAIDDLLAGANRSWRRFADVVGHTAEAQVTQQPPVGGTGVGGSVHAPSVVDRWHHRQMPLHADEYLGHFWRDGLGLAAAAEVAGLASPVAACPGWSVADLVWHTGEVFWFWGDVVEHRWTDPSDYVEPDRPGEAELLDWYRASVDRTLAILTAADPREVVWSWAPGGGTAAWVSRRMAHEAAVHRGDAEDAAGSGWAVESVLASDGVDEFLEHFTGTVAGGAEPLGGTVHLHCTDVDGEWLVTETDTAGPLEVRREHAKGDAAVRGPASDLLLVLWRRRPLEAVEVIGGAAVARRLVARADLE